MRGTSYRSAYQLAARCLSVLLCILFCRAGDADAPDWYLFSRHGQCAAIENLKRKVPEVIGIETPGDFAELMRAQGYEVIERAIPDSQGQAVQVDVPEKGLALIFVTASVCDDFVMDGPARSN
jgi:hypothetical protein